MQHRDREPELQILLNLLGRVIEQRDDHRMKAAGQRIASRLRVECGVQLDHPGESQPVCSHLEPVYSAMEALPGALPELASAFMTIEPRLKWERSKRESADPAFASAHANAMLIGPGGIEEREDIRIGASLMAPHITYPRHHHPPEEVYVAFTPGEWWNAEMDWTEPGAGGLIYNPPGILHAMRSHAKPLLAVWLLPV
jgi:quercetin dioxygenase-like cupin family protein